MNRLLKITAVLSLTIWLSGCFVGNTMDLSLFPKEEPLMESVVHGSSSAKTKILMVDISGILVDQEAKSAFGLIDIDNSVARLRSVFDKASEDDRVKAVLLRVNSPGGAVTAAELMHREIENFRRERGIPVYVLMMDMAASGGYYISMAADRVYALPTTATGSIGVIIPSINFAGLMNRFGVKDTTVKSGPHKDILSPLREPTEDDRKIIQSVIDDYYSQFVDRIAANRKELTRDQIVKAADGRIYTARQALELKLIDGIRHMDEVLRELEKAAGGREAQVIVYRTKLKVNDNIYVDAGAAPVVPGVRAPALYLWAGALQPADAYDLMGRSLAPLLSR